MPPNQNEIEVFRIDPEPDKCYKTAEYTREEGRWPYQKFYTTHEPKYVGRFINEIRTGRGDGASVVHYFHNDLTNLDEKVRLSYATTSYIEVKCESIIKREKIEKMLVFLRINIDDIDGIGQKIFAHLLSFK